MDKCFEGVVLALYLELGNLFTILFGLSFDYGENGISFWAVPFRCVLLEVSVELICGQMQADIFPLSALCQSKHDWRCTVSKYLRTVAHDI